MNNATTIFDQPLSDRLDITLLDGRTLSCILKSDQPHTIEGDRVRLDTSGQYLVIGGNKPYLPPESLLERGLNCFNRRIFWENAWLLYKNSDNILTDSRMFLSPLKAHNNLAYFGTNGLKDPTVGVYIEWWLHYPEISVLPEGLIWHFAGSPLSGTNSCGIVTPENRKMTMHSRPFRDIWRSFIEVNTRYTVAKQRCETYALEDVIILLRGEEYRNYLNETRQEEIDLTILYNNQPARNGNDASKNAKSRRRTLMQTKWKQIMDFYSLFLLKESEAESLKSSGNRKQYLETLHSLAQFAKESMEILYGRNVMGISLSETVGFAKYKKSQGYY